MPEHFQTPIRHLAAIIVALSGAWSIVDAQRGSARAEEKEPAADPVSDRDRGFWSFQKLARPKVPRVQVADQVRTPIDAFLHQRLEDQGLSFSPEADRATLVRRLSLDLLGLPPSPDVLREFLADDRTDTLERLIDRLLTSPHFGERWGRHWLDVAGYVDTVGFDVDPDNIITSEGKWRYRDYVIRAFNEDKPFNRFVTEQLAGDELVDWRGAPKFTSEIRELLIATGFLRTAQDFTHEDVGNIPENHFGILHDTIEIVGTSLLGLTLNCARCHNHKFDPVPQEDYYRLMAAFTPAYNPQNWKIVFPYDKKLEDRFVADVSPSDRAEIEKHNAAIEQEIGEVAKKIEELRRPHREKLLAGKLEKLPEPIRADTKASFETPADKRNEIQKYLASKFEGQLKVSPEEIAAAMSEAEKTTRAELTSQIAAQNSRRRSFGKIQALFDVGPPPVTRRLIRGNYQTPGEEVEPGYLRVLCDSGNAALMPPGTAPHAGTSGRRLALAHWLTARHSRAEGLLARVMVTRIWQHLFGAGLVSTPENLGLGGAPPSHPELLEWLSAEFVESGWSIKSLIRLIVRSSAYRQSAGANEDEAGRNRKLLIDPDNKLLGRMTLKRLESEAIRDCVLETSGSLDVSMGGAPIMLEARPDGMIVISEKHLASPGARFRRSAYLLARRAFPLSEFAVFDQPVVATSCPERGRSAVPLQSLTMLNGAFLWEQAERFAGRLERASAIPDRQIRLAFELALSRHPSAIETARSLVFLNQQASAYLSGSLPEGPAAAHKALVHFCHTLLNTSEFLYVP